MKQLWLAAVVLAACGDNGTVKDVTPDADVPVEPPAFEVGCTQNVPEPPNGFATAADFGPVTPGTLKNWDPNGRWFFDGVKMGSVSSVFLEKTGSQVIVDRDDTTPGTIDDDALFHRFTVDTGQGTFSVSKRIIDLRSDGTARADRAVCDGQTCRVCTAKLVRATHANGEGESDKLSLVGSLFGSDWDDGYTFNVRVIGNLAYLIRQDGLRIIDTTDPAHPTELGHFRRTGDGYSNDVKLVDAGNKRYALIADYPVDIVDVTDPAHPVLAGQIPEEAHTVFVETRNGSTRAYFGNYDASCPVYDVTDPTHPTRLGRYTSQGSIVHDLSISDGIAYLNSWDAGFEVVDFNTPATPTRIGHWADTPTLTSHSNWTTTIGGRHLAFHGEEEYGAHFDVVDLDAASPTYMQPIGTWKTRDYVSIHNIMAFGTKAYFSHYQDGIRVLDVSDPTHPVQTGFFNTWDPQGPTSTSAFFEGAVGIDVDQTRKLIFVADSPRGLLILQDDTP